MAKRLFVIISVLFLQTTVNAQYNKIEPNNSTNQTNMLVLGDSSVISDEFNPDSDIDLFW